MASKWMAAAEQALAARSFPKPHANSVISAKSPVPTTVQAAIGTIGTFGTSGGEKETATKVETKKVENAFSGANSVDGVGRRPDVMAWHQRAAVWYREHGHHRPKRVCAGCGASLRKRASVLLLPYGERAHADDGYHCIIAYGIRWKREAAAALEAMGIPTPDSVLAELNEEEPRHDGIMAKPGERPPS